jgi:hypothetical protein
MHIRCKQHNGSKAPASNDRVRAAVIENFRIKILQTIKRNTQPLFKTGIHKFTLHGCCRTFLLIQAVEFIKRHPAKISADGQISSELIKILPVAVRI